MTEEVRPIFYVPNDCVDVPLRADRWMAQTGGTWMAVSPGESEADWFEDCDPADLPTPRVRAIDDVPTTGTLIYMRHDFDVIEFDTATGTVRHI